MPDHRSKVEAWYRSLRAAAPAVPGRRGSDARQDALHDAVALVLSLPGERLASPVGYLLRAARSMAVDALRRRRREERFAGSSRPAHPPPSTPEGLLDDRALLRAVQELPAPWREALILSRVEGLTHRQIAVRQGVSGRTVRRNIERALGALLEREPE